MEVLAPTSRKPSRPLLILLGGVLLILIGIASTFIFIKLRGGGGRSDGPNGDKPDQTNQQVSLFKSLDELEKELDRVERCDVSVEQLLKFSERFVNSGLPGLTLEQFMRKL